MTPTEVKAYLGIGCMGGHHQRADPEMFTLWKVGVDETRDALRGPWQ